MVERLALKHVLFLDDGARSVYANKARYSKHAPYLIQVRVEGELDYRSYLLSSLTKPQNGSSSKH